MSEVGCFQQSMELTQGLTYIAGVSGHYIRPLLLVSIIAFARFGAAQNVAQPKPQSLCKLEDISMGNHVSARVAAVAEAGADMGVLTDPHCPSRQPVWFSVALKSRRDSSDLAKQIERSGKAVVIFSGELYGPPEPGPKLPDSIRKNYRPGWGHLGGFPMKLVVFRIEAVAPAGKPYNER